MTIAILADEGLKAEWLEKETAGEVEFIWADSVSSLLMIEADAYFDLLFQPDPERSARLQQLKGKRLFINSVAWPGRAAGLQAIRINAWPTLLRRSLVEVALTDEAQHATVETVFNALQWRFQVVPDITGMITPRVLATIFNEAWFTLQAGVSSKDEIDIAMKLGTNYPMGPFEWGAAIGWERVATLLKELSRQDARYTPAPALELALEASR
ncbi:3-hydroxyacyl-CoA dehydrogenase family protein [Paraflavitalea pollutisoli]|uniref:3-hydroxyacyl-CoA dehydrogenase family protein n=1 Tax=Paraflavitalea pollutisoli TaxID=3034143 RepID=UPI0023EB8BB7|nr:3-hydroxyacyl-CoA dehydrogenase family protein [Paraflavitalea sp. H1-2-19X]